MMQSNNIHKIFRRDEDKNVALKNKKKPGMKAESRQQHEEDDSWSSGVGAISTRRLYIALQEFKM
jgi:hypothetical protein